SPVVKHDLYRFRRVILAVERQGHNGHQHGNRKNKPTHSSSFQTRYNVFMDFLDKIVEERIQRAQEDGLFDNLPGKGKPLTLEDDSFVPEDVRLMYKILKNSNCLPIEMELRKQIFNLHQLLNATIDNETRRELRRELNLLVLRLNVKQRRALLSI